MARLLHVTLLLALALGSCCATVHCIADDDWKPPGFYRGKDGPIYDVIASSEIAEGRMYRMSKWVTTNITAAKSFDDAFAEGTKRLGDYFGGANTDGEKVADTVPTVVLVTLTTDKVMSTTFTVEQFLPHELFDAPPAPSASELRILEVEPQKVWVRTFGGYLKQDMVIEQVSSLIADLKEQGLTVEEDLIAVAAYDSPIRLVGRHNEVWVWEKNAPSLEAIRRARAAVHTLTQEVLTAHPASLANSLLAKLQAAFSSLMPGQAAKAEAQVQGQKQRVQVS